MLQRFGSRSAVDDFAMGNSSPRALGRLPFERPELDRSFISGIGVSGEDARGADA